MGKDVVAASVTEHHQKGSKLIRPERVDISQYQHTLWTYAQKKKVFSTKVCDLKHTYGLTVPVIR